MLTFQHIKCSLPLQSLLEERHVEPHYLNTIDFLKIGCMQRLSAYLARDIA